MSKTIKATFDAVAGEAEAAIAAARAADPDFNRKIDEFVENADYSALRVVIDLKPRPAFRVEVMRVVGDQIDGMVVCEITPPTRAQASPTRPH